MSGLTGNNILAGSSGQGGYEIEQSLRFNDDDSPRLTRQYVSAGNRKIYTLSCWVKRGALGDKRIFGADGSSNFAWVLQFDSNNKISVGAYSGGYIYQVVTTAVYRDVGAWYHIVVATDTTQATASDRIKIYVNGEQVTAFDTASYPSLNLDTSINNNAAGRPHGIGYIPGSGGNYDGYLAELNVVDGQALTPSDFGETDLLTNQWIPKKYVGTYGTNGFYLNFSDSASLGADSSGNGNNFTPTNLAATDQVLDSPTNNFATLNPLNTTVSGLSTISEGNLKTNVGGTGTRYISSATQAMTFGKWYCEVYVINTPALTVGLIHGYSSLTSTSNGLQMLSNGYSYNATGIYVNSDSITASGLPTYSNGDVIGIMYDADVGKLEFVDNTGTKITTVAASGLDTTVSSFFAIGDGSSSTSNSGGGVMNFGQDSSFAGNKTAQGNTDDNGIGDFYYTPPSGYLALCEDNLPDPSIADPTAYFNTVLYTGNGSTQSITGVGFQPNLNWIKARNSPEYHVLHDVLRGANNRLFSNTTDAETTAPTMTSFDSDGFSVSTDGGTYSSTNANGTTYAAWNWKGTGGAAPSKTYTVTVTNPGSGNRYTLDGRVSGTNAIPITLEEGGTYTFDQSDSSNSGHPLRFSTTSNGTHGGGSEYTTGVTTNGTPGSAGAYTRITVAASAPTLYYYCTAHSDMGAEVTTPGVGGGVSSLDGTIASVVNANTTAGFSIVSYTGTGVAGDTMGHGLSQTPEVVIMKKRASNGADGVRNWTVWHKDLTDGNYLYLSTDNAQFAGRFFGEVGNGTYPYTEPTASLITFGGVNTGQYQEVNYNGDDYIMYCFHSVEGYSKIGSYTGNGNADGAFVYTGFRPAFVLFKLASLSGDSWTIIDNKRDTYNQSYKALFPNLTSSENTATNNHCDFVSNGIKIRNNLSRLNAVSQTYIYMAFAENPVKYSNAR